MFESAETVGAERNAGLEGLDVLVSLDGTEPAPGSGDMGIFGNRGEDTSVRRIPTTVLRENLQRTVDALQEVLASLTVPEDGMRLRQAQVSFEITATGGIAVVGTSAQVGAKGAITLTFGS
ncbi:Pepco domain-containing protein [Streptomyces misionensis]|uniref:Pepco domain-containing protein n=1 Tax=Streptomyces misionensis TaxID=67331 RepID=UPI00396B5A82